MTDIRAYAPRVADVLANNCDKGDNALAAVTELAIQLERELAEAKECHKSGTHEDTRRLRRFAEMALAFEGKDETFGSQLTADRELGFLREDFLGEHAKGADAYTAFCRAIDDLTDSAELPPKPRTNGGDGPGTNTGHGHVWERPDGVKMRCGGPPMCHVCALDAARWKGHSAGSSES